MQNHHEIEPYENLINESQLAVKRGVFLNDDDKIRQWAIGQLACQGKLDLNEASQRFDVDAKSYFAEEWKRLEELAQDNLVSLTETHVKVEPLGRLLLRPILLSFDAYFNADVAKRFSKVL